MNVVTARTMVLVVLGASLSILPACGSDAPDSPRAAAPAEKPEVSRMPTMAVTPEAIAKALGPDPEIRVRYAGAGNDALDYVTMEETLPLDDALATASAGIRVPADDLAGAPLLAMVVGTSDIPRNMRGIAVLFSSGARFFATPSGATRNFEAELATMNERDMPPFTDKRTSRGRIVDINGSDGLLLPEGEVVTPDGQPTYHAPAILTWQKSGIEYHLKSRVIGSEQLVEIARLVK